MILCDRFVLGTLRDAVAGRWPIVPRVTRWSEATEDISAFRRLVADGPLSIAPECRALAVVRSLLGDRGRATIRGRYASRRSDTAGPVTTWRSPGVLAAGAVVRSSGRPRRPLALPGGGLKTKIGGIRELEWEDGASPDPWGDSNPRPPA